MLAGQLVLAGWLLLFVGWSSWLLILVGEEGRGDAGPPVGAACSLVASCCCGSLELLFGCFPHWKKEEKQREGQGGEKRLREEDEKRKTSGGARGSTHQRWWSSRRLSLVEETTALRGERKENEHSF